MKNDLGATCEDCGLVDYPDWTLLPHSQFNEVCPNGAGLLCFPCFVKRAYNVYGSQLDNSGDKPDRATVKGGSSTFKPTNKQIVGD